MNLRPRWRKVLHDLVDSRLRTALVVVSIAVGVFSIGVIAGTYVIISEDMSASYAANNPMNIELRSGDFDSTVVDSLAAAEGVRQAEGRRVFSARVRLPGTSLWKVLDLVAVVDFEAQRINRLTVLQGAGTAAKKEILLERKALGDLAANPGTDLEVQLQDGSVRTLRVAGIVQDQTTGAGDFLSPPLAFIATDSLPFLRQPQAFNRLYVTLTEGGDDESHLRQMTGKLKDRMLANGVAVVRTRTALSHEHPMSSTVQAILGILGALGVLILFLSSSLIANTLNALLSQHLRPIGVMKLVGGRRQQIFALYIVLILAYCLIALAIAIPLGAQGAYALAAFIASKMNFNLLGYRLVPLALGIQVLVGLAVPILVGLAPVLNGSRISVQRALSNDLSQDPAASKLSAASPRPSLQARLAETLARRGIHLPRPLLMSIRNTFRRKRRLALTLFTLTMGGAIFIAVFNVRVSLHDYIGEIGNYFLADVTIDFDRPYRLSEIEMVARQVPGVVDVEGWAFAAAEVLYPDDSVAENLTILAPPADSKLVSPILVAGRWLQPGDRRGIAVSESILERFPSLKPGHTLRLTVNGGTEPWQVVGLFKFTNQQGTIAYATYETISILTGVANRSLSFRVVSNDHAPAHQQVMSEALDAHFRSQGYKVRETRTGVSTLRTASESLDILVTFLLIMAVLTASVGSMGLAGAMGMNVLERTREIGIMRSIGATDRGILRLVVVEGVVIGGLSWILAVLLSFPITYLLSSILSLAIFRSPIDVKFTLEGFGLWLLVVLALSALASVLPARSAARLTIREVLAYE
jgi:putative ABC transport system permease protein